LSCHLNWYRIRSFQLPVIIIFIPSVYNVSFLDNYKILCLALVLSNANMMWHKRIFFNIVYNWGWVSWTSQKFECIFLIKLVKIWPVFVKGPCLNILIFCGLQVYSNGVVLQYTEMLLSVCMFFFLFFPFYYECLFFNSFCYYEILTSVLQHIIFC
jgi:hypothetical protein